MLCVSKVVDRRKAYLQYFALCAAALIIGFQLGYTMKYVNSNTINNYQQHEQQYLFELESLRDQGLITASEFKKISAKHRDRSIFAKSQILLSEVQKKQTKNFTEHENTDQPKDVELDDITVHEQDTSKKLKPSISSLCDGTDPSKKKLVFIKVENYFSQLS